MEPLAAYGVDRFAFGDDHQPAGGIVRDRSEAPVLQGLVQCILEDILRQLQIVETEEPGQYSNHPPRLMTEKMVDQYLNGVRRRCHGENYWGIGFIRRSSSWNSSSSGHFFVSSVASSMSLALMTI